MSRDPQARRHTREEEEADPALDAGAIPPRLSCRSRVSLLSR